MFVAAVFTIAKTWKQPRCLLTDEWIKKLWHIYTMGCSVQFSSVAQSCLTLCNPMNCSTPGWGNSGSSVRLYYLGSKITADGDCNHEIKRRFLLERKVMANLDSIFKSRDTTLPTQVHLVKAMVCPMVMNGYESWTVKKAECQRIALLNCGVGEDSW